MKNTILPIVIGVVLLAGCGERAADADSWTPLVVAELDTAQEAQHAKATAARDAMFGELMETLTTEIAASGPAGAIEVCREAAPRIATSVSEQEGVTIGRTSWKLRNPASVAPGWAASILKDRPEESRVAHGPEGQLGVTWPIRVATPCLTCHGVPESIPADVRDALASLYPEDAATGFAEGDLRGWFWVEVPPAAD